MLLQNLSPPPPPTPPHQGLAPWYLPSSCPPLPPAPSLAALPDMYYCNPLTRPSPVLLGDRIAALTIPLPTVQQAAAPHQLKLQNLEHLPAATTVVTPYLS